MGMARSAKAEVKKAIEKAKALAASLRAGAVEQAALKSRVVSVRLKAREYDLLASLYRLSELGLGLTSFNSFLRRLIWTGILGEMARLKAIGVLRSPEKAS